MPNNAAEEGHDPGEDSIVRVKEEYISSTATTYSR